MKKLLSFALVFCLLLALLAVGASAYDVVRSPQKLMVNGEIVDCDKYNIDGSNYFKLRDLAYLLMDTDAVPYANYLTLCLDCGDTGSEKISYWGGETGAAYDLSISIWLMTNGRANMAAWDYGFTGKGKIDGGIYKGEFSLNRSSDELLKSKSIYYGAYLTNQTVEKDDEGNELWLDGDTIGVAPAQGEDMAKVK